MQTISARWWVGVPLAAGLLVNEQLMLAIAAMTIGGRSLPEAMREAAGVNPLFGYLFFTAFRMVPYALLIGVCGWLSRGRGRRFLRPVLIGGCLGIAGFIAVASWMVVRPLFSEERVSSTAPLAFLAIPFYACISGAVVAGIAAAIRAAVPDRGTRPAG